MVLPESGTHGRQLRIDTVNAFGPGYTVSYWDPVLGGWSAYCDVAESPYAIAMLGEAIMRGVPAFGFPKIRSLVGRIRMPTFSASPL